MSEDTSPAEVDRYQEMLRALAPHERLRIAVALSMAVRRLAEAGIRQRHPLADEQEVRVRLVTRLYGREVALQAFQDVPDDAV
jgi:hypothetical protein